MSQRIYQKKKKSIDNWGYWGEFGDIEVGISSGTLTANTTNQSIPEALHYHKTGVIFILGLEGEGKVEVDGNAFNLKKDEVLRIAPGEKYRHLYAEKKPFSWITFCTVKDPKDKVLVD